MISQKSQRPNLTGGGWFSWKLKFLGLFLGIISFSNLIFSNNTSALFTPTLSASVDQANLQVNGNQVINSTNKTIDIPFNFTVNTNNRTGYTVTVNSETDNTALVNSESSIGSKINSIGRSSYPSVGYLPNNTWAFRVTAYGAYYPIPALSEPMQIIQTTEKTKGNESNQLSIGMKLSDNLESGNYTNKLVISVISNPYEHRAVMTNGPDFNTRVGNLDPNPAYYPNPAYPMPTKPSIKYFRRSQAAPPANITSINIEDSEESDYEIKAWFNSTDGSVYYYSPKEEVFLNKDSRSMFQWFTKIEDIDLSGFNTSETTIMASMFYWMAALKSINLTKFNTSKVTDMSAMFDCTYSLKEIDVLSFDTANVTNMEYMFFLSPAQKLDLSNFNTKNVTNMFGMFEDMHDVKEIKFGPQFITSNVVNMGQMFKNALTLPSINLSTFDTRNVENMAKMFSGTDSIVELDLSSFVTTKVKDFNRMFEANSSANNKLQRIYVSADFSTISAYTPSSSPEHNIYIFLNCSRLTGGSGSRNPNFRDLEWLRIDDPAHGRPGYFTRKT